MSNDLKTCASRENLMGGEGRVWGRVVSWGGGCHEPVECHVE